MPPKHGPCLPLTYEPWRHSTWSARGNFFRSNGTSLFRTTRSPQSPTLRQSQAPFLVAAMPSSAISPDLTKRSQRTRHCDITSIRRSADYPAASGNVLQAGPAAGGSTRSAGTTITPLLQTSGGLPSEVVTVERRYSPRWLRDDDDDDITESKGDTSHAFKTTKSLSLTPWCVKCRCALQDKLLCWTCVVYGAF